MSPLSTRDAIAVQLGGVERVGDEDAGDLLGCLHDRDRRGQVGLGQDRQHAGLGGQPRQQLLGPAHELAVLVDDDEGSLQLTRAELVE